MATNYRDNKQIPSSEEDSDCTASGRNRNAECAKFNNYTTRNRDSGAKRRDRINRPSKDEDSSSDDDNTKKYGNKDISRNTRHNCNTDLGTSGSVKQCSSKEHASLYPRLPSDDPTLMPDMNANTAHELHIPDKKINIKDAKERKYPVHIDLNNTVYEMIQYIESSYGPFSANTQFLYSGKKMENDKTLAFYNLQYDYTIIMTGTFLKNVNDSQLSIEEQQRINSKNSKSSTGRHQHFSWSEHSSSGEEEIKQNLNVSQKSIEKQQRLRSKNMKSSTGRHKDSSWSANNSSGEEENKQNLNDSQISIEKQQRLRSKNMKSSTGRHKDSSWSENKSSGEEENKQHHQHKHYKYQRSSSSENNQEESKKDKKAEYNNEEENVTNRITRAITPDDQSSFDQKLMPYTKHGQEYLQDNEQPKSNTNYNLQNSELQISSNDLATVLANSSDFKEGLLSLFEEQDINPKAVRKCAFNNPQIFSLKEDIVQLKPDATICREHNLSICSQKKHCPDLHICQKYLFGTCNNSMCLLGHRWNTGHNDGILSRLSIQHLPKEAITKLFGPHEPHDLTKEYIPGKDDNLNDIKSNNSQIQIKTEKHQKKYKDSSEHINRRTNHSTDGNSSPINANLEYSYDKDRNGNEKYKSSSYSSKQQKDLYDTNFKEQRNRNSPEHINRHTDHSTDGNNSLMNANHEYNHDMDRKGNETYKSNSYSKEQPKHSYETRFKEQKNRESPEDTNRYTYHSPDGNSSRMNVNHEYSYDMDRKGNEKYKSNSYSKKQPKKSYDTSFKEHTNIDSTEHMNRRTDHSTDGNNSPKNVNHEYSYDMDKNGNEKHKSHSYNKKQQKYSYDTTFKEHNNQKKKTFWANNFLSVDTEINEICYYSVEERCRNEAIGCKRLHSTNHFHWQVRKNHKWYNLTLKHAKSLEYTYCDPQLDYYLLEILDLNEPGIRCSELFSILRTDKWNANLNDMTLTNINTNNRPHRLRRVCTEYIYNKQINSNLFIWYFIDKNETCIPYGKVDTTGDKSLKSKVTSKEIENKYQQYILNPNKNTMNFRNEYFSYEIDFDKMTQTNMSTKVSRNVKRRPMLDKRLDKNSGIISTVTQSLSQMWNGSKSFL